MSIDRFPKKPCRFCGGMGHFSYSCYKNPKPKKELKRTQINKVGKYTKQWLVTRATWIRKNPPAIAGKYWKCYLGINPWCPGLLTNDRKLLRNGVGFLTLDHVVARSSDHSKKFSQDNLQPACIYCNNEKGSKKLEDVKPPVIH